jgi:oligopeptide transport system permease protein
MMNNTNYINIPKEKFEFVSRSEKIHDKKLDTKPIGYFKDALIRFRKNKGSVVAFGIILILVIFAIVGPYLTPYELSDRDGYYIAALPKSQFFSRFGFWDGTSVRTDTKAGYYYYNSIGQESGMHAIVGDYETDTTSDGGTSYSFRVDSYYKVGYSYLTMTKDEYEALKEYQNSTGKQIIYPMPLTYKTNYTIGNSGANLWYKLTDESQYTTGAPLLDDGGNYIPNYLTTENYKSVQASVDRNYDSKRIDTDDGTYIYAVKVQGGVKVRVNYYEYYSYINGHEPSFLFGANGLGQDIFTCLANGARLSFILAIVVSAINLTIGAVYGAIEGYYGGAVDMIMERISDILSSVPFIVVATLFQLHFADKVGILPSLLFAFVLTGWIGMASRVRMQFYRFKGQEYVLAARTLGAKDSRLMFKHIFPNALGTIITGSVLAIPGVIFSESMLSFLGIVNLSTSPNLMSIGTMLSQGNGYLTTHPHVLLFPAVFISLLEISFNLFGNGLRDAFNPSLRGVEE